MKTYVRRRLAVEVESANDILHVRAEFFPGVALREDIFSERFCDVATVGFLGDFKDEFVHGMHFTMKFFGGEDMTNQQRFLAVLEKDSRALGWTVVRVPFDPAEVWAERVRLRVCGEVNGIRFRTSLFPDARGGFYLLVNRVTQAGAGLVLGATAEFALEPDLEARTAELPDELAVLLEEEEGLRAWYDGLTEYTRREIGKWVCGVKSEEARLGRAEQMAERLLATMEAERELPPAIASALGRNAKAKQGWERMSVSHRRAHLMAIFSYRSPESREKRIGKMVEECVGKVGK